METQAPDHRLPVRLRQDSVHHGHEDCLHPLPWVYPAEILGRANAFGWENRMDGLLAYMYTMIQECAAQNIKLDRAFLNHCR